MQGLGSIGMIMHGRQEEMISLLNALTVCRIVKGLLHRWTLQLDLGITAGGLERTVSLHNST